MPTFNNARHKLTKEERIDKVIDTTKYKTGSNNDKLSNHLSQANVKAFNSIIVDKCLTTPNNKQTFKSDKECFDEVSEYFKLCSTYNIAPTIASLSVFLGVHRDTIYSLSNNPNCTYSDTLKKAIDICHHYLESSTLSGAVAPLLLIFLGKNYYNLSDSSTLNLTSTLLENSNQSNTMNIVKEQLEIENNCAKND